MMSQNSRKNTILGKLLVRFVICWALTRSHEDQRPRATTLTRIDRTCSNGSAAPNRSATLGRLFGRAFRLDRCIESAAINRCGSGINARWFLAEQISAITEDPRLLPVVAKLEILLGNPRVALRCRTRNRAQPTPFLTPPVRLE